MDEGASARGALLSVLEKKKNKKKQERVVGIVFPLSADKIKKMQMLLCADLANIGSPVACASLGMLRGGGIAHATFATAARNHPQVEAIYRWGWKLAFGAAPPQELLQCWDAVLQTRDNGKFHGNRTHTDAKGDYNLQCEIVFWPPWLMAADHICSARASSRHSKKSPRAQPETCC